MKEDTQSIELNHAREELCNVRNKHNASNQGNAF